MTRGSPGDSKANRHQKDEEGPQYEQQEKEVGSGSSKCATLARDKVPQQTALWGKGRGRVRV